MTVMWNYASVQRTRAAQFDTAKGHASIEQSEGTEREDSAPTEARAIGGMPTDRSDGTLLFRRPVRWISR